MQASKSLALNDRLPIGSDNEFLIENYSRKCCTKHNFFQFCKKFITFMISRVGLMIVMVGYVLAGGVVFETLEAEHEHKSLRLSESVLEKMLAKIYRQIEGNSTRVRDESFYFFLRHEIREFTEFITNATRNGTLTGNNDPQWDFFGSVFYCVTLVSTIGYGHITCRTKVGKVFTIIYSSIGIPLMALFLANTGSSTATMFRFIYTKLNLIKRKLKGKKRARANFVRSPEFESDIFDDYSSYNEQYSNPVPRSINNNVNNEFGTSEGKSSSKSSLKSNRSKNKNPLKGSKKSNESTKSKESQKSKAESDLKSSDAKIERKIIEKKRSSVFLPRVASAAANEILESIEETNEKSKETSNQSVKQEEAMKRINDLLDTQTIGEEACDDLEKRGRDELSIEEEDEEEEVVVEGNSDDESIVETNPSLISDIFTRSSSGKRKTEPLSKIAEVNETISEADMKNKQNIEKSPKTEGSKSKLKGFKILTRSIRLITRRNNKPVVDENKKSEIFTIQTSNKPSINEPIENSIQQQQQSSLSQTKDLTCAAEVCITQESGANKSFADLNSKFKRNFSRSAYSYDATLSKTLKRSRFSSNILKSNKLPLYNAKQLHLIYQQYQQEREEKYGVPMLTTLIIMPCYLVCGMLIFSSFEEWRKLDALYFCFVTLTTIGFGDFIPGSTLLNKNGNKKNMYISALYIFVGLILIAMCINLMSKQIKLKIKAFAKKIGLSNC